MRARDRVGARIAASPQWPVTVGGAAIKFLAGTIKRRAAKAAHHPCMRRTIGHRVAPNLKSLYAETRILRDTVLRRIVADGYEIAEESLPDAQAIVSANIGALVAAPEFEILLGYSPGEARILLLLVDSCATEIADTIGLSVRERRKARLVADNDP